MASTFTSRIRLNKQGDGDNPNSWGVVLNDGVISLVDDAIAAEKLLNKMIETQKDYLGYLD